MRNATQCSSVTAFQVLLAWLAGLVTVTWINKGNERQRKLWICATQSLSSSLQNSWKCTGWHSAYTETNETWQIDGKHKPTKCCPWWRSKLTLQLVLLFAKLTQTRPGPCRNASPWSLKQWRGRNKKYLFWIQIVLQAHERLPKTHKRFHCLLLSYFDALDLTRSVGGIEGATKRKRWSSQLLISLKIPLLHSCA